ncbi:MAG: sulfatase [Phycisphaerae bacterium]
MQCVNRTLGSLAQPMNWILPSLALALAMSCVGPLLADQPSAESQRRPNILFIMVDDLGPEWLGCYGSEHKTPRIDRLAETGIRFRNVWATPLCTPTRHELLTGRYPFRTGWTTHHDSPRWGGQHFDPKREYAFARALRDAGYATAIAGKWQINDLREQRNALQEHGFDEHCVWPGFETGQTRDMERYFDPFVQINGQRPDETGKFGPDLFCQFIIDFMKRHRDRPFLVYYPMVLTHTPFTRTPHNRNDTSLPDTGIPLHPGMVDYVDHLVGRLMDALDELRLRENTLVILTSDNGTVRGVKGRMKGRLVNGGKGTLTEAGIGVPLMVSWPGRAPKGTTSTELVDFSDFFPTLLELTGARPPEGVVIDGKSFAATLRGRDESERRREWIFSQLGPKRVIRDERFKLWSDGKLFDVQADPAEQHDLTGSDDPQAQAARKRLQAALDALPPDAKLPFPPRAQTAGK